MHIRSRTQALTVAVAAMALAACGQPGKGTTSRDGARTFSAAKAQPLGVTGAIFTTDASGNVVNGNIYASKEDVYLNGGPRKPGAAGLPDGDYYFLITDPGCKTQLAGPSAPEPYNTSDTIIHVENGEFTSLVQLAPFLTTPNNGGEYKVHVTMVSNYSPGDGCYGFVPKYTKTDNFKVRPQAPPEQPETYCISGYKFYDRNGNGELDSPELPLPGITIVLTHADETTETTMTSATGQFSFCGLEAGEYDVTEMLPDVGEWWQTVPASGGYTVTVGPDVENLAFGNFCKVEGEIALEACPLEPEATE